MRTKGAERHPGTLIVGVSNPATADDLVRLSAVLARAKPWKIVLTHVVKVANQISLTTGRFSPEVVRARDFLEEVQAKALAAQVDAGGLIEVARSVDEGLLAAAESHDAGMILVGYSGDEVGPPREDEGEERFDRAMHRVARKTHADVVVAKFRRANIHRILVPLTSVAPLRLTGHLCRALAAVEGSSITFFHAAKPEAGPEAGKKLAQRLEADGLASLGPLEVVYSDDPVEAIATRAEDQDLVILGPSGRPRLLEALISSRGRRIAEGVPASVLIAWGGENDHA